MTDTRTGQWRQQTSDLWRRGRYTIVTGQTGYALRGRNGTLELGTYATLTEAQEAGYAHSRKPSLKPGPAPGYGGRTTHYAKQHRLMAEVDGAAWERLSQAQRQLGCSQADALCCLILSAPDLKPSMLPPKRTREAPRGD